jgi:hypothetical protein
MMPDEYRGRLFECPTCRKKFLVGGKSPAKEDGPLAAAEGGNAVSEKNDSGMGLKVAVAVMFVWAVLASMMCFLGRQSSDGKIRELLGEIDDQKQIIDELEKKAAELLARAGRPESRPAPNGSAGGMTTVSPAVSPASSGSEETSQSSESAETPESAEPNPVEVVASAPNHGSPSAPPPPTPPAPATGHVAQPASTNSALGELDQAKMKYEAEQAKFGQIETEKVAAVKATYGTGLQDVMRRIQGRGDLDGVLLVKKEIERFASDPTLAAAPVATPQELKELQVLCNDKVAASAVEKQQKLAALRQQYIAYLDSLEKKYTKQGQLEKALEARKEKEGVK